MRYEVCYAKYRGGCWWLVLLLVSLGTAAANPLARVPRRQLSERFQHLRLTSPGLLYKLDHNPKSTSSPPFSAYYSTLYLLSIIVRTLLIMASTDLATLLDMGFDEPRAKLATQKTGGCMSLTIAHFDRSAG